MYIFVRVSLSIILIGIFLTERFKLVNALHESQHFKAFEVAKCEIVHSENLQKKNNISEIDIQVNLISGNKTYSLLLLEDLSFSNIKIKICSSTNCTMAPNKLSKFYQGTVKNKPLKSFVIGYTHKGIFSGRVTDENETYFVESAIFELQNKSRKNEVVIYRLKDTTLYTKNTSEATALPFAEWLNVYRTLNITRVETAKLRGVSTDKVSCEIEMVADHTLFRHFKRDSDRLSAYLYIHAKEADSIFRQTDFSMSGKPDGIRIILVQISIYKTIDAPNYPMSDTSSLTEYLKKLTVRQQDSAFCLSMSMSSRGFEGSAIGETFKAAPDSYLIAGGICERPYPEPGYKFKRFYNIGAVNIRMFGKPLPLAITLFSMAHEIGHAFGAAHDPEYDSACSPNGRFFLMHSVVIPGYEQLLQLSTCSRSEIWRVLQAKGECLKKVEAVCGDGFREGGEECDCGSQPVCRLVDRCCHPPGAEKGCTLTATCSPKESPCCNSNCLVKTAADFQCYEDPANCLASRCDGVHPECPKEKTTLRPCTLRPAVCDDWACVLHMCSNLDLIACRCEPESNHECLLCCEKEGKCLPASVFGLRSSNGLEYVLRPGTKCKNGTFLCDTNGRCENPKLSTLSIVVIVTVSILLSLCLCYLVCYTCIKMR